MGITSRKGAGVRTYDGLLCCRPAYVSMCGDFSLPVHVGIYLQPPGGIRHTHITWNMLPLGVLDREIKRGGADRPCAG